MINRKTLSKRVTVVHREGIPHKSSPSNTFRKSTRVIKIKCSPICEQSTEKLSLVLKGNSFLIKPGRGRLVF